MIFLYAVLAIYFTPVAILCLLLSWEYGFKTVFIGALFWPLTLGRALIENLLTGQRW